MTFWASELGEFCKMIREIGKSSKVRKVREFQDQSLQGLKSTWIYRTVLKSPWKLNLSWKVLEKHLKALKSPWILPFTGGLNTVFGDINQYEIVVPLFGAVRSPWKVLEFYKNLPVWTLKIILCSTHRDMRWWLRMFLVDCNIYHAVCSKVVVLLLIRCWLFFPLWYSVIVLFCCVLLYIHSSFAVILMGKRELVALLCLPGVSGLLCGSSSRCHRFVCNLWLWYANFISDLLLIVFAIYTGND